MIQKYSAIHTAIVLLIGLILNILPVKPFGTVTTDDFETPLGKALFVFSILFVAIPIGVNTISMFFSMVMRGKWLWLIATFFLAFLITVPYYFVVYSEPKNI